MLRFVVVPLSFPFECTLKLKLIVYSFDSLYPFMPLLVCESRGSYTLNFW